MRALTLIVEININVNTTGRNNEVLAREGIDTIMAAIECKHCTFGNNEVLAREGIDTLI